MKHCKVKLSSIFKRGFSTLFRLLYYPFKKSNQYIHSIKFGVNVLYSGIACCTQQSCPAKNKINSSSSTGDLRFLLSLADVK